MTRAFNRIHVEPTDPWPRPLRRDPALFPTPAEAMAMTALWANGPMKREDLRAYLLRRGFSMIEVVGAISQLLYAERVVERDGMLRPAAALYAVPVRMPRHWFVDDAPSWPVRFWRWLMAWCG